MARTRRRTSRRRNKGAPAWLWAFIGLLAGLSIAVIVYLTMRPAGIIGPAEIRTPSEQPAQPRIGAVPKQTEKPITPPKPRFDFYNLLPEMEVVVPEQEIRGTPTREGVKRVEQPGTYLLQAGSFPSHERADRLRAKLALLGLETRIQTVNVDNQTTWHRVRVGPYKNLTELNEARASLKQNGIDAILIRLAK